MSGTSHQQDQYTNPNGESSKSSELQLDLMDKDKVSAVMRRCRKVGGIQIKEAQVQQFQTWFRTLTRRGYVSPEFLDDHEKVKKTFREDFPNGMTRGQYVRSMLTFFAGLDDEQFSLYFPGIGREQTVHLLLQIGTEGTRDHRQHLADKKRREGAFHDTE